MIKIIWTVAFLTTQGPATQDIAEPPEHVNFPNAAECKVWGVKMSPRMEDWIRGRLQLGWEAPVRAVFRCEPNGEQS